jgi:DNA polymerase I
LKPIIGVRTVYRSTGRKRTRGAVDQLTKLSLVTAESVMVSKGQDEKVPTVVLIGRDEEKKKRMWRTVFWPYCYILEEDYMGLKPTLYSPFGTYIKESEGTKTRSLGHRALTKLILKDGLSAMSLTHFLKKDPKVRGEGSIFTYEADVATSNLLSLRFLIDKSIKSGVDILRGRLIPADDFYVELRKWYLDLEALSNKLCRSGPKPEDPIPIFSFYDNYNGKLYTYFVRNKMWVKDPGFLRIKSSLVTKHHIIGFDNEGLMLEHFLDFVKELDPDLLTAWNLDRYDIVKLIDRIRFNHLDPGRLSPFKTFAWREKPYRIKGRITFDLMRGFKRFTDAELRSYALGWVSEEENLGVEKVPLKKPTQWIWDNEPETLFRRNVNDVLILVALDRKYDLVEMFDDLRREFGCLFQEVLMNYRVLDTALLRFINGKIALGTAFKEPRNKESFLGAIVIEPELGLHKFIAGLDFNREYPSIIQIFNISPETYRDESYTGECYTVEYRGTVYKFVKEPRGLLPQLIDFFFKKRNEYEQKYLEAIRSGVESQIKAWYRKVFNIKKMTNAIYGVMDFPSFRLYRKECTAATATIGRISIEELERILTDLGYKLIYGDTDSTFVALKSNTPEEAIEEAKNLTIILNERLSKFFIEKYGLEGAPSGLGVERIYSDFLLVAKKSYAGKYFWDEKKGYKEDYYMKGLEIIRSDSSDFEKKVLERIIKGILNRDFKEVDDIILEAEGMLKTQIPTPLEAAYPLQLKDWLKNYPKENKRGQKVMPAHVKAAVYSNLFLNTEFDRGDKPRRLPIVEEKKKKVTVTQTSLFGEATYPTTFVFNSRTFNLNGISITEDVEVPKWFLDKIDWNRITKRFNGKIRKIKGLIEEKD